MPPAQSRDKPFFLDPVFACIPDGLKSTRFSLCAVQMRPQARCRELCYEAQYYYLFSKGFWHEAAENVASWASDVPCGSTYELDGAEICIEE